MPHPQLPVTIGILLGILFESLNPTYALVISLIRFPSEYCVSGFYLNGNASIAKVCVFY